MAHIHKDIQTDIDEVIKQFALKNRWSQLTVIFTHRPKNLRFSSLPGFTNALQTRVREYVFYFFQVSKNMTFYFFLK